MSETGWLIEEVEMRHGLVYYWAAGVRTTNDHLLAVRFARRQDAEWVLAWLEDRYYRRGTFRVVEHAWGGEPCSGNSRP